LKLDISITRDEVLELHKLIPLYVSTSNLGIEAISFSNNLEFLTNQGIT